MENGWVFVVNIGRQKTQADLRKGPQNWKTGYLEFYGDKEKLENLIKPFTCLKKGEILPET